MTLDLNSLGQLPDLPARVAALEQQLQELGEQAQPDQLTAGAYTINAKGEIETKVSGRIEAKGLTLQESQTDAAAVTSSILWQHNGGNVEQIAGYGGGTGGHTLELLAYGAHETGLYIEGGPTPADAALTIAAGNAGRVLLNGDEESSFLQLAGAEGVTAVSFGLIGPEGEILYGSGDYSVSKEATGEYKIEWATAKTSAHYAIVATAVSGAAVVTTQIDIQEAARFQVAVHRSSTNELFTPSMIAFIAIAGS